MNLAFKWAWHQCKGCWKIRNNINRTHAIDKMDLLPIYTKIQVHAFSRANILSGFAAAGLILL